MEQKAALTKTNLRQRMKSLNPFAMPALMVLLAMGGYLLGKSTNKRQDQTSVPQAKNMSAEDTMRGIQMFHEEVLSDYNFGDITLRQGLEDVFTSQRRGNEMLTKVYKADGHRVESLYSGDHQIHAYYDGNMLTGMDFDEVSITFDGRGMYVAAPQKAPIYLAGYEAADYLHHLWDLNTQKVLKGNTKTVVHQKGTVSIGNEFPKWIKELRQGSYAGAGVPIGVKIRSGRVK